MVRVIDAHLLQKAGPVPQPGYWPSPGRGSGDTVDPGSPAGPAVNHLLGVSLCPIGCLGPQPSGLKPRVGSSSPASVRPMSWGNGLMLLASEMGGLSGSPPSEKGDINPALREPQFEGRDHPCPHWDARVGRRQDSATAGEKDWKGRTFRREGAEKSQCRGRDPEKQRGGG